MNSGSTDLLQSQWLKDKIAEKEAITMPDFATKFNYFNEMDADKAYISLLSKSFIARTTSTVLLNNYGFWKRNDGDQFWASRIATLSKTQVAGDLVTGSVPVAKRLISEDTQDVATSNKRSCDAFSSEEIRSKVMPSRRVCEAQQIEDDNTQLNNAPLPCSSPSSKATSVPSADGASSAPMTSTPVPLKRGRTSRRKTVSVAEPTALASSPVPSALSAPMASDTVPTFDPSAFGSSRPQISHPWHDLVRATLFLYEGEDVELPSEQSGFAEQDPEKRILYKLALRHLQNAQAEMQRSLQRSKFDKASPKFDKASCTDFKDAFVALSGVWNVFSKEANRAFQSADLQEVEELCRMTELENKDADVMEILNTLADKSRKAPLTDVVDELCILLSTKPERRPLLMVLLAIGEQGCAATALSKSQLAKVFDTGTTARKCDCLFTVKGLEVGNVEAKRISATKLEVVFQLRKNIKINKSILLQLEKYGVECPPLLSIHASYSLVKYEEQAAAEDELVSLSREEQATLLEWEHVVVHTPTKPKLNKKISFKVPDNALFWKKVEEIAEDREDEDDCEGE
ncbi:hypothetical protein BGZ79_000913 [Entomortierella chlamydospora]|nr:hypothetical protein BGZ79_000913 [Entomortierella chlamydospora]